MSSDKMLNLTHNIYYRRLANVALWPAFAFLGIFPVIVVSVIFAFYLKYVPNLLVSMQQLVPPKMLVSLETGIYKIIVYLSVWIFVSFVINVALVYVAWNIKKLLRDLDR